MKPDKGRSPAVRVIPSDSRTVESEKGKKKRSGSRGTRRRLEAARHALHDIRSERDPLARRHLDVRVLPEDELNARDWTRPVRASDAERDITHAYNVKRGEIR